MRGGHAGSQVAYDFPQLLEEFETILATVSGEEKIVFEYGCREFQYSLEAVLCGNYRHAFANLRLTFELFLSSIYFSAFHLKLKLWLKGKRDLIWSELVDVDNGVYSHSFIQAFNPGLSTYAAQYLGLANTLYRECSQYVHGNPETHEDIFTPIEYNFDKLRIFHEHVDTVRLCVLFAFAVRYMEELTRKSRNHLEPIILDCFSDLPEIQAVFGVAG